MDLCFKSEQSNDEQLMQQLDHLFRRESSRLTAALVRLLGPGHLQLAEDAVQETMLKAMRNWSYHGMPPNPSAWLNKAAKNAAIDLIRRESSLLRKLKLFSDEVDQIAGTREFEEVFDSSRTIEDDQLRLMFLCCHPDLKTEDQTALMLRSLCGLSVKEISMAYLLPETTLQQRLTRAKRTLKRKKTEFSIPDDADFPRRLETVHQGLYLMFNEGYSTHSGEVAIRRDLCLEAIRLTRILLTHPCGQASQTHALLALMLFQAARLPARTDAYGEIVLLENQDRTQWDRKLITEGLEILKVSMRDNSLSEYHLEAGIALCHVTANDHASTNWRAMSEMYDMLLSRTGSSTVALNRAIAYSFAFGVEQGLLALNTIDSSDPLLNYSLYHTAFGALYTRAGDDWKALQSYQIALESAVNAPERRFLLQRISEIEHKKYPLKSDFTQ